MQLEERIEVHKLDARNVVNLLAAGNVLQIVVHRLERVWVAVGQWIAQNGAVVADAHEIDAPRVDADALNSDAALGNEFQGTENLAVERERNQLTSLDVSKNTELTVLKCSLNQLIELDVSKTTKLTELVCINNPLTELDVSKNTALTRLECQSNQRTSLDVSKNTNLTWLNCQSNQLTLLDVSSNNALTDLRCQLNQINSLKVTGCTALISLWCNNNKLISLDVSTNTALSFLNCGNNQLTLLNVSGCRALGRLWCHDNQLASLEVSKNTELGNLLCQNNQLTSLNVSNNTALTRLVCYGNQIKGKEMDAIVQSLTKYNCRKGELIVSSTKEENDRNICTKAQVTIANNRGWNVYYHDGGSYHPYYEGSVPTEINLFDNISNDEFLNDAMVTYEGQYVNVILNNRAFYKTGIWNTICLPFDLDGLKGTPLAGATLKTLVSSNYSAAAQTLTLNFSTVSTIEAGKPYIVKWNENEILENPTFDYVIISTTPAGIVETDCVDFIGNYSPVGFQAQERTILYMGSDSKLYYPGIDMNVNSFRAYFKLKNGLKAGNLPNNGAKNIVLNFDGETTFINTSQHSIENSDNIWVDIYGRKLSCIPTMKGIYIVNGKKIVK